VIFFEKFLQVLETMRPEIPILLVHEDQKSNDWTTLFQTTSREVLKHDRVFVLASATSFHEAVMPSNSVDFFLGATCFHWLPRPGPVIEPHEVEIAPFTIIPSFLPSPLRERFHSHALAAWRTIIGLRSKEMKSGASGVITMPFLQPNQWSDYVSASERILKELVEKGLVLLSELVNMKTTGWPHFQPSELIAPLATVGLVADRYETIRVEDPFREALLATNDREAYGQSICNTWRATSEPTMLAAVAPERRVTAVDARFAALQKIVSSECLDKSEWVRTSYHVLVVRKL